MRLLALACDEIFDRWPVRVTFEFSRLPFVVLLGYLAFAETIDAWTWIGALIIFASAIYITRRESRLSAGRS